MTRSSTSTKLVVSTVLLFALAGCNSSSSPTSPAVPILSMSVDEDLFSKVNASRASNNLPPVRLDPELSRIAENHSYHMLTEGSLTHEDENGGTVADRLGSEGVVFSRAGENIGVAAGETDPAARLHAEFMASGAHRRIILEPSFTQIGIGYVISGSETWVTEVFVGR